MPTKLKLGRNGFEPSWIRLRVELGANPVADFEIMEPQFDPGIGATLDWDLLEDTTCGLVVVRRTQKRYRCEPRRNSEIPTLSGSLEVPQRESQESIDEFTHRVMKRFGQAWASVDGTDAPPELHLLENAWDPGETCLIPGSATGFSAADALLQKMMARQPALRGVACGWQRDGRESGLWRFRFHLPDSRDSDHQLKLDNGWVWPDDTWPLGQTWIQRKGQINDDALTTLLRAFLNPDYRTVTGSGFRFPRLPMTVGFSGTSEFCDLIQVDCRRGATDPPWALDVSLRLAPVHRERRANMNPAPVLLLGSCVEVPTAAEAKLYLVAPAANPPAELTTAARWKLDKDARGVVAARAVPGFVRPEQAAFYSRLKIDDLVWLRLGHGEIPVILGSLHQCFPQWEGGAQQCDVAIGASAIELGTGADGTSRLRLADGKATIVAPEQVVLQTKQVEATERLAVRGALEGHDTAAFKGNVTVA